MRVVVVVQNGRKDKVLDMVVVLDVMVFGMSSFNPEKALMVRFHPWLWFASV